jgi:hypothetical protein
VTADPAALRDAMRQALADHHLVGSEPPFRMGGWRCSCGHGCANGYEGFAQHLTHDVLLAGPLADLAALPARLHDLADQLDVPAGVWSPLAGIAGRLRALTPDTRSST